MSDSKSPTETTPLINSNATYDVLKQVAQVWLPALATLYFALSQIWGLPAGGEVVGTLTAIDTFLGVTLHISNVQYNNSDAQYDGHVDVVETDDKKSYLINLKGDADKLDENQELRLKVKKPRTETAAKVKTARARKTTAKKAATSKDV